MYDIAERDQLQLPDFSTPFGDKLLASNRWVRLAAKIDWEKMEDEYARHFSHTGKKAISCRVAYAALIIREMLSLSDRETVLQITENPYLQYFCGYKRMLRRRPFSVSSMRSFRQRFPKESYSKKYIKSLVKW